VSADAPLPGAAPGAIDSPAGFAAALRWAVGAAAARRARRLVCVADRFDDWPLDDAPWLAALRDWLRLPQRQCLLLARHWDEAPRRHPRFLRWRRDWAHAVATMQPAPETDGVLPSLVLDDGPVLLHLADPLRWRGQAGLDAAGAQAWRQRLDETLQQAQPALPPTTLGL
jgi:hypothetical protein